MGLTGQSIALRCALLAIFLAVGAEAQYTDYFGENWSGDGTYYGDQVGYLNFMYLRLAG